MGLSVNALVLAVISGLPCAGAFVAPTLEQGQSRSTTLQMRENRRAFFVNAAATIAGTVLLDPLVAYGEAGADTMPDSLDVNDFLRKGQVSQPMGVSGQAGKSRPETGVVLRDGSDVMRDKRSGAVNAEVLVGQDKNTVLTSFESPWPVAKGSVFDVECRDGKTGDGAFMAVTGDTGGKSLSDLPDNFFLDVIFSPTGRYSFYGQPTDIKVKKSYTRPSDGNYRILELTFSNLSQSTQTEIPRNAIIAATIPDGTSNAVMLVGGANASRWRKGDAEKEVRKVVESFQAVLAPKSSTKVRAKGRGRESV